VWPEYNLHGEVVFDPATANRGRSALGALAAEIHPRFQGRGLASQILAVMADLARDADLAV
jgi:GNAT superfamily N-acetyltransferase